MIEAHQPLGGSFVGQGGDRVPSRVQKPSESLQLQQRGDYNDDLSRVDIPPRTACQPRLHWLICRDWLLGFDPTSSQLFRPCRESRIRLAYFSHTAKICNATAVQ